MTDPLFTTVIGLEVHVQLKTKAKLFCRCSTAFGAPPNTQTCPVCIGMPGSLPVMNREAFRLALRAAVALHCRIPAFTKWDRKNYYYPDLPKGYQISQFDLPLSEDGYLDIHSPKGEFPDRRVRIIRAHLEEDAGKSMHDEIAGKADSRIDLNRTGTPLLEIVSHPDMRSAAEAKAYLNELKLLLHYLGVSDCNMQEGSLRVDANINLHVPTPAGTVATPIVEVKNMNSFRAVERAMLHESARQFAQWQQTGQRLGDIPKQTRGWDDQTQVTRAQRHKEESSDYRYFPDPDLVPVQISAQQVAEIRAQLGRLPVQLRKQLTSKFELPPDDADLLVNQGLALVEYFEALVDGGVEPRRASNWLQQDVLRALNERKLEIAVFPVPASELARLLLLVQRGELDNSRAKDLFAQMVAARQSLDAARQVLGIESVDPNQMTQLCQSLLDRNPRIVADVKNGKQQAVGALIGQARQQNPNANPAQVREICLQLIRGGGGQPAVDD